MVIRNADILGDGAGYWRVIWRRGKLLWHIQVAMLYPRTLWSCGHQGSPLGRGWWWEWQDHRCSAVTADGVLCQLSPSSSVLWDHSGWLAEPPSQGGPALHIAPTSQIGWFLHLYLPLMESLLCCCEPLELSLSDGWWILLRGQI